MSSKPYRAIEFIKTMAALDAYVAEHTAELRSQLARVERFFCDLGIGAGDDPIGNLLASHGSLAAERDDLRSQLARANEALGQIKGVMFDVHANPLDRILAVKKIFEQAALTDEDGK